MNQEVHKRDNELRNFYKNVNKVSALWDIRNDAVNKLNVTRDKMDLVIKEINKLSTMMNRDVWIIHEDSNVKWDTLINIYSNLEIKEEN